MVIVKYNLSDEIMRKIKRIIESGGFEGEKDVVIRAISNLYEETLDDNNTVKKQENLELEEVIKDISGDTMQVNTGNPIFNEFSEKAMTLRKSEETFSKRCVVPDMLYGENDFGIIWKFHNRFFCQKWILIMFGHFMLENVERGKVKNIHSWVELHEFRDYLEIATKDLIDIISRNEDLDQLLVGFPSNRTKFLKTPRLRKMRQKKVREAKAKQLEVVSMERFLSQNFRVLQRKEEKDTRIAGACFEFGLFEAIDKNKKILIQLTNIGRELISMRNPTITKIINIIAKHLASNLTMKDFNPIFSKDEQKFILEKIITKFELENKIVKRYLEKNRIDVKEMIEIFLEEQKKYMKWGKDVVDEDAVNEYGKGKATTIMRRLVEIGQFKRKKEDGFDKSGKKMQVIVYERI